ncbi:hypothetical protein BGZ95_012103 [Linnemannia exigua]|uniref:Uncharacterized protein n=1 Tax=Linnemannia exigua TaxID=604196 RepID=A0AAD4D900_9FUNG|nr:hypothetical protein BGZ95_012103 [Linnemannia exigua]
MPPDRLPVVTTIHLISLLAVNCAVLFKFVDEYHLYYNPHLVYSQGQVWRLVTSLLYHGHRKDFNLLVKLSL